MIEYQRDVPDDLDPADLELERAHVRDHVASLADPDDDPATYRSQVRVWTARHPEDPHLLRIEGRLDGHDVVAPYLEDGYDPLAGVDPALYAAEVAAAEEDLEVLRGQA